MPPSTLLSKEPMLDLLMARSMDMGYSVRGSGSVSVGYSDHVRLIFFKWKGVDMPRERLPGGPFSGPPDPAKRGYRFVEVDPPVDYVIGDDGLAEAGYGVRRSFFRWRGVRFDLSKISPERLGILLRPDGRARLVIVDIDVPEHRRDFAEELKRTVPGETREKKEGKSAG